MSDKLGAGASEKAQRMIDERLNPTFIRKTNLSKQMKSEETCKVRIVWSNSIPDVEKQINDILQRGIVSRVQDIKFIEVAGKFVACVILWEYSGVKSKI